MKTAQLAMGLIVMLACNAWAGDAPYLGKWKLNPAKSDFGDATLTFQQTGDGAIEVTDEGKSYTVKTDGKEYPTPWGVTMSIKSLSADRWERISRVNGKVTSTAIMKVSLDGKTLTIDSKGSLANGEAFNNVATFDRVSGTSGLMGKWKLKKVDVGAPQTMMLAANGKDGITLTMVEDQGTCAAKLDGKDHPAKGPLWPSGWTCAVTRKDPNGLEFVWKKDGKTMYEDSLAVSDGGRTLTDLSKASGSGETVRSIYEKR